MTFDVKNFDHSGGGFNASPKIGSYITADAVATVQGAGYFNDASDELKTGDLIYVAMSDDNKLYWVTVDKAAGTDRLRNFFEGTLPRVQLINGINGELAQFFKKALNADCFLYRPFPKVVYLS